MSTLKGSTALATVAYTPDAADHLVDGDALHVQFVSPPLAAQTISAQTVTLVVQALEPDANNNLFVTWKLFIWTAAGAVGSTVLAIKRDATEVVLASTNRTDSATTTSVTIGNGDRLVLEIGLGGTPTATGGVQGHNGSMRFGESGATDATANDTGTATTENPWLEFANVITLQPVTTTTTVVPRGTGRVATAGAKASATTPNRRATGRVATVADKDSFSAPVARGLVRMAVTATAFVPEIRRRAVVTWAQFLVPEAGSVPVFVEPHGTGRIAASGVHAGKTQPITRAVAHVEAASAKASQTTVSLRGTPRNVLSPKAATTTVGLRGRGSSVAVGLRKTTTTVLSRIRGRAAVAATAFFPPPTITTGAVVVRTRARLEADVESGRTNIVAARGWARTLVATVRGALTQPRLRSVAHLDTAAVPGRVAAGAPLRARSYATSEAVAFIPVEAAGFATATAGGNAVRIAPYTVRMVDVILGTATAGPVMTGIIEGFPVMQGSVVATGAMRGTVTVVEEMQGEVTVERVMEGVLV